MPDAPASTPPIAASAAMEPGSTPQTLAVFNPASGAKIADLPTQTPDQVAEMFARARIAQTGWAALGFAARAKLIRKVGAWVVANKQRVAETVVAENGKTVDDALNAEVLYVAMACSFWAKQAERYLADEKVRSGSPLALGKRLIIRYEPRGVIGVIGPWNYPLTNNFGDCIPALMAGNAVVLKPASLTPTSSLLIAEGLLACGAPADVFQVVVGAGSTLGNAVIDNSDFVFFTGSTEVGRGVAERCARNLIPYGLELGGNDPMIVLRDANLERAANCAVYYSMQNGGQTCISVERVYVEEPIYDEFVAKVSEKVAALRQGPPIGSGSQDVGAVTSPRQLEVFESQLADAEAKGARVLQGGHRGAGAGDFFEPTLLVDVDHSMECMREETFGPTLPIMKVADAEQAIELANDSPYGLQASVFGSDIDRAEAVARRIEAGAVCVNDAQTNYAILELPMGGWKTSGVGSRHGAGGIRKYCREQSLCISPRVLNREPHHFPYSARRTRILQGMVKLLWGRAPR